MADIEDELSFNPVPLIEEGDLVKGGLDGAANKQAIVLAGRTNKLKSDLAGLKDGFDKLIIPANTVFVSVSNEEGRLALEGSNNLIIAKQESDDILYYLNGGEDPSKKESWLKGSVPPEPPVIPEIPVTSVFGRTGDIKPGQDDYTTDQVKETDTRIFISPEEKQRFANKQDQLVSGTSIKKINGEDVLGTGEIELNAESVGADEKGTAAELLKEHIEAADPHTQYLNKARGDAAYVQLTQGNKPLGFLALDEAGKIPANVIETLQVRYLVVQDDAARLSIPKHDNLTIAAQLNGPGDGDDRLYYLNGGADPSVESNWLMGSQAVVDGVTSAFGRTGIVTAQTGDYNADQVTETEDRVFLSPTEKAAFANKQDSLVSGTNVKTINGKSLVGSGNVDLTFTDVGADKAGTAEAAITAHVAEEDPHLQYLNETRGDGRYVALLSGNKPNGYLKLDDAGKVPAEVIETLQTNYVVVESEEERLALPKHDNLTICAQLNGPGEADDRLYYLNGGKDPSVAENWVKGSSAVLEGVTSAFGRTGQVTAEAGDYNADQVTQTETNQFVTPEQKVAWDAKQEKLVSGTNLKTVNGKDLLGEGDTELTAEDVGADKAGTAADAVKTHEEATDPHEQYHTDERGDLRYFKKDEANTSDNPVTLNAVKKIPVQFMDIYKSIFVEVEDDAARLALESNLDMIIATQASDSTIYYLNGGLDPSVADNWIKGQVSSTGGVNKVFGRVGDVIAKSGDYKTDQITETADRVFVSPQEKQSFAGKQDLLVSGENLKKINNKDLLGSGVLTLTASDVEADAKGTAKDLMDAHKADADPHAQYLKVAMGNQANGFLQLDAAGKIPSGTIDVLQARYITVADDAARLALPKYSNLTIAAQINGPNADDDRLYYLNGDLDPSVADNWLAGNSATIVGTASIFGRTGVIEAQAGDYNADQITETATRKFVSPEEKTTYTGKQDKLVSATNIRSLFGKTLLGSGNLTFTPAELGSASAVHSHKVADISDWKKSTQDLIVDSLEPGDGITLGKNPINGKTIISASGGSGEGDSDIVVVERTGSTANQTHVFAIPRQTKFALSAHALKEVAGSSNQTTIVDDFNNVTDSPYEMTNGLGMDGNLRQTPPTNYSLTADGSLYSLSIVAKGISLAVRGSASSVVPAMTSATTPSGYVVSASSANSSYPAWKAFDGTESTGTDYTMSWVSSASVTDAAPQWIGIQLPEARGINSYKLINRPHTSATPGSTYPASSWTLQGSNDWNTWTVIHTVNDNVNSNPLAVREFALDKVYTYKYYRIHVTKAPGGQVSFNKVIFGITSNFVAQIDGVNYAVSGSTKTKINEPLTEELIRGLPPASISGMLTADYANGIKLIGDNPGLVNVSQEFKPQIAISQKLTASTWSAITSSKINNAVTGAGTGTAAVSRDLKEWFVFANGNWSSIGALTADEAGGEKIANQGMSLATVNALTKANWASFYSDSDGIPDSIAFAIGLKVPSSVTDSIKVSDITLTIDEESSWLLQTPAQVEIRWRKSTVSFKTITAGNYKLVYQTP